MAFRVYVWHVRTTFPLCVFEISVFKSQIMLVLLRVLGRVDDMPSYANQKCQSRL